MSAVGWGVGAWGASPWGDGAGFAMTGALAAAENVVQVVFDGPVYASGLGDEKDAIDPAHYVVTPVAGTRGFDGTDARAVTPVLVAVVEAPGFQLGQVLALTLDRPMTPYPAAYDVACTNIWKADLSIAVTPDPTTIRFPAVFRRVVLPDPHPTIAGDIASPQTMADAIAVGVGGLNPSLASYVADATGDYAPDSGIVSLKKRIYRRIVTTPGGFLHLGQGYGAGVLGYGKKLARVSERLRLVTIVEQQVALEPEVLAVKCTIAQGTRSGLWLVKVAVRTSSGQSMELRVPVRSGSRLAA